MKFKKNDNWPKCPDSDIVLFWVQRMDELLFIYTLDTYKPSALNSTYLCQEAISLIDDIENKLIEEANLRHVLEELQWSISNDKVAKQLLDIDSAYYMPSDKTSISIIRLRLEVLYKTIGPIKYLNTSIKELIDHLKIHNKREIEVVTKNILTVLINLGVNKRHIYKELIGFFLYGNNQRYSGIESVGDFLKSLYSSEQKFKIYLATNGLIKEISNSVHIFKIKILSYLPEYLFSDDSGIGISKKEDEVFIEISDISAYDPYSARERALEILDRLSDLFTLFHHKEKISWSNDVLIWSEDQKKTFYIEAPNSSMEKPYDYKPQQASKELNNLLVNFSEKKGKSFSKFVTIADLHGMCVSGDVAENQLINLWTSIETIVPRSGGTKIVNIFNSIKPFLILSYVKRIIEGLTRDMVLWNIWKTKKILKKVNCSTTNLNHRLANLLSVNENNDIKNELYDALGDFHLLRHRVYGISKILATPKDVITYLSAHEQKVAWQIRRIYRTRNLIVHTGNRPPYLSTLIENGHEYLDQIIFGIIHISCNRYKANSLEQAFEIGNIKLIKYMRDLKGISVFDSENTMILLRGLD